MIKAVTFDLINTLVKVSRRPSASDERIALLFSGLKGAGIDVSQEEVRLAWEKGKEERDRSLRALQHFGARHAVDCLTGNLRLPEKPRLWESLREALADELSGRVIWTCGPGALEVLTELRSSGLQVGIVSNIGLVSSEAARAKVYELGLVRPDDHRTIVFSADLGLIKPHPALFREVLMRLGTSETETLHVGDSRLGDVVGARHVGMPNVRYSGLIDDRGDPEADYVVAELKDILELVHMLNHEDGLIGRRHLMPDV